VLKYQALFTFSEFLQRDPGSAVQLAACTSGPRRPQPHGHTAAGHRRQLRARAGKGAEALDAPGPAPQPLGPHGHAAAGLRPCTYSGAHAQHADWGRLAARARPSHRSPPSTCGATTSSPRVEDLRRRCQWGEGVDGEGGRWI